MRPHPSSGRSFAAASPSPEPEPAPEKETERSRRDRFDERQARLLAPPAAAREPESQSLAAVVQLTAGAYQRMVRGAELAVGGSERIVRRGASETDAKLAQKLGQLQPFIAVR